MENKNLNERGFDVSFKNWVKIMWEGKWIQIFAIFFTLLVIEICNFSWCIEQWYESVNEGVMPMIMVSMGILLPLTGSLVIVFKAFIQIWRDYTSGISR